MYRALCLAAAFGLLSFAAQAASLDAPLRSRAAKPKIARVAPAVVPQVIPPCVEIRGALLECSPRALLNPYDPRVRVFQGTLARQYTPPYPKLSSWPPYY